MREGVISSSHRQGEISSIQREGVTSLTQGVVNHYSATFLCLAASLHRLNSRQEVIGTGLQEQAERLEETRFAFFSAPVLLDMSCSLRSEYSLEHMASQTLAYRNKLIRLKEDMSGLGERSARLRARAARLQVAKQEEAMEREVRGDTTTSTTVSKTFSIL